MVTFISDLNPLASLTQLQILDLTDNQIDDIVPLGDLTQLESLLLGKNNITTIDIALHLSQLTMVGLEDNAITDIRALVENTGLGEGDSIGLTGNPLGQSALCNDIPALEARGVVVSYDGECSGATLDSISISGSTQVNENSGAQYSCTAHYSDSSTQDVTNSATWSEDSSYASINSTGYLTTSSVSSDQACTITATYGGKTDTHNVTIKNVALTLDSISISGSTQVNENSGAQ